MKENSIEEDIKILEKKIEDYKPYKNIEYCSHAGQILQEEYKALEHILSDYKRVLKENETLKNFVSGIVNENIEKDFIPVQKVKDKIEEVRKMKFRDYSLNGATIDFAIMKFRELLEKERRMVKIRDNVNKIELESFLLEKGFYQMNGQWRKSGHFKISKNGHIIPLNGSGSRRFDIIYEMTEKGFIERVEENEE